MPDLELVDVGRTFESRDGAPNVVALKGVNLRVPQGDYVAIIGPSGGGKSTLLNVMGLLEEPTEGSLLIDGIPASSLGRSAASAFRASQLGFVFQSFHLLDRRPVIDSVALGTQYQRVSRIEQERRAGQALRAVALNDKPEAIASTLSGGQRQRVAIARAIAAGAQIILADEPTGNLDSLNAARVIAELERLNEVGVTLVIVTHSEDVAARARRRVQVIDGAVIEPDGGSAGADLPSAQSQGEKSVPSASRWARAIDDLRDAWRSVLSLRAQSIALIVAVGVAVALALLSLGVSSTASAQVTDAFDAQLNREVSATWSSEDPRSADPEVALKAVREISGVTDVAVMVDLPESVVASHVAAVTVQPHFIQGDLYEALRLVTITATGEDTEPLDPGEVFVGEVLARQLSLGPLEGRPTITIENSRFVVAGLIVESPRLPLLTGELLLSDRDSIPEVGQYDLAVLTSTFSGAAQQVASQTAVAINPFEPDSIQVSAPTDSGLLRGVVQAEVQATLAAMSALAGIAATAFVVNGAISGVVARRAEIGLRKAVGATRADIVRLVLVETVIRGGLGGAAGLFAGVLGLLAIALLNSWAPVINPWVLPGAVAAGVAVGGVAGLSAARIGANVSPSEALRS